MHWVLQNAVFSERGWDVMLATLRRFDIPFSEHRVVPFLGELEPDPVLPTRNVMCMGSYSMRHAARKHGWVPGVFDLAPFDFRVQLKHWGSRMLNADSDVVRFEDVAFGDRTELFIRPIQDSKHFAGGLFTRDAFEPWQRSVVELKEQNLSSLRSDTLVQVAVPKQLYREARFWIVRGRVVASSIYRLGGRGAFGPIVDERFHAFASELVAGDGGWLPLPAFCLDLCDTPDGMKVVEINTINASGFYDADVQTLIMTIHEAFDEQR